jgi:hypothetical protein
MDEDRKSILIAGVFLGDMTLAQASLAQDLPPYVGGLDIEHMLQGAEEIESARAQVEEELAQASDPEALSPGLVRTILKRAIERGKFHSAHRCLEILDEKDAFVGRYIREAINLIEQGDLDGAARSLAVASNLDLEEGIPMFQYAGYTLHEECTRSPEKCVTAMKADQAVRRALRYLLGSVRVSEALGDLRETTRRSLLPRVALIRDPHGGEFYAACREAHSDIEQAERNAVSQLADRLRHIKAEITRFAGSIEGVSQAGGASHVQDALKRVAGGLQKQFTGVEDLLEKWQFRRLKDRLEQLIESKAEIQQALEALRKAGSRKEATIAAMAELIEEIEKADLLGAIETVEQDLVATQAKMLGRAVHSQEHWQFLREIAFKYPVSPLLCCLRQLNDRWLVVPRWESDIAGAIRDYFESGARPTSM